MNDLTLLDSIGYHREQVISRMSTDLDFMAQVCLPEVYRFPFSPLHHAVWQILCESTEKEAGVDNLAFGIPRGFAKTVLLKLFAVRTVLFTKRQFIVACCNTEPLAMNFIADVCDVLASENIRKLFGDYRATAEKDTQQLKKFSICGRSVILLAVGKNTSVRGLNIKYIRPDVLICDDMQAREEAQSPTEARNLRDWFVGTLLKFVSPQVSLRVFVGNMYPCDGSLLKLLKRNPLWVSFITGAILEDGESIWPELKSKEELLAELESDIAMGCPEIFYAEVMNDEEAGSRAGVDISLIQSTPLPGEFPEAGCIIIDPSMGKKRSDDLVLGVCLYFDQTPHFPEILVGKFNPLETAQHAIRLALKHNLRSILVESVAYQASLVFWINQVINTQGIIGLQCLEIYPRGSKTSRIIAGLKDLQAKKITLGSDVRNVVVNQIVQFDPTKTNNKDDILDVIAYAYPALTEYGMAMQCDLFQTEETSIASGSHDLELAF
jgi:hypothetical protein